MKDKYNKNIFIFFSVVGFFVIFVASFITYIVSAYQINRTYVEQQLRITGENIKLHLTTDISGQLELLKNLGRSPIIREYFVNPHDRQLGQYASAEFAMFQKYSSSGMVFWINDIDKLFHVTGATPYVVDPDLEENYWYNLTLYETQEYNFNINYNPDIDMINLWVNIPVYEVNEDETIKRPIGMLGTGFDLTRIIELVNDSYKERGPYARAYLFNKHDEITVAQDFELVNQKVRIDDHLGLPGHEVLNRAKTLEVGESEEFIFGTYMYHVGAVAAVKDWFVVIQYKMPGILALNQQMNLIFFGMLILIFLLLIVMNYIVAKSNKDMSEQNNRLNESNDQLNMVVQATRIGLWYMDIVNDDLTDPNTTFIWSDEFRHMLGFQDQNDFPNLLGSWVERLHPEDRERTILQAVNHIRDKTNQTPYDVEYRLLKKDGEYSYFRAYGGTFRDEYGTALRIAGSLMDITETKNMLIDLEKQRTIAEVANKAKSDFLAKISHEIRTPMNSIIGISQIQLQNYKKDDHYSQALEKIYNSGCNLLGIINDILDLSKIETGKMEINPIEYCVPSLLHDAVQLNILQIGSKQLEFLLDLDESLPSRLIGDELRIKQILNNLLSNAIKYSTKGHVKLSVRYETISDETNDDIFLNLIVEDTGHGLKPEDCKKLFSEYMRFNIKETRTVQGTGIGLSITKSLVELMDGTIKVESEYGKGSRFTVRIKQKTIGAEPIGSDLSKQLSSFTFSGKKRHTNLQIIREVMPYGTVLVVDDVETNLYVANGLMMPYQLNIETALSGEEAIGLVKSGKVYDVIFMDHMMPTMDGIEATHTLRIMGYKGVIVALTANAISGNAEMFKKNGFDDFISKPIDIRVLNSVLNTYVRDRNIEEHRKYKQIEISDTETEPPIPDKKVIDIFKKDVQKSIITLKETTANQNIKLFTTTVHGVKTVLASIGEHDASEKAAELENAGLENNESFIVEQIDDFILSLETILGNLSQEESTEIPEEECLDEDKAFLIEQLNIIKEACENCDDTTIFASLEELKKKSWKKCTTTAIEKIYDNLYLHSDFEEAISGVIEILTQKMKEE